MQSIDQGLLLEIVGRVYDCVIDAKQWRPAMDIIRTTFGWHNLALSTISPVGLLPKVTVMIGFPQEYMHIAIDPSYNMAILDLWGGIAKVNDAPLEEPLIQSQMGDATLWAENRFFADFVRPQGIVDAVTIGLVREPDMVATLTGGIHGAKGHVTDAEMDGLRVIAPHLRRAVTIANLFNDMQTESAMFATVLERSRAGIILVDEKLGIVHANALAHRMLSRGDPIREQHGRLALREELSQGALATAVAGRAINLSRSGSGIPSLRSDGSPVLIHVLPLEDGELRRGMVPRASAAVFVAPPASPINLPAQALSLLFDLTPAEVRIMELIADGLDVSDAARALGIAKSTVRTHLIHIYQKTGTRGQKDVASLVREIAIPW